MAIVAVVTITAPAMVESCAILTEPPIQAPPATIRAPVVVDVLGVVSYIVKLTLVAEVAVFAAAA